MSHAFGPDVGDVLIGLLGLSIAVGGIVWLLAAHVAARKTARRASSSDPKPCLSDAEVDAVAAAVVAATAATVTSTVTQ